MSRLLLVEDYPPLARVVSIGLGRLGHKVERAGSIEQAKALEGSFDAAVLDLELPDGDGVELAGWLLDRGRVERIVFYTATRDKALRVAAAELGPLVEKDGSIDDLVKTLANLMTAEREVAVGEGALDRAALWVRKLSGLRRKVDR